MNGLLKATLIRCAIGDVQRGVHEPRSLVRALSLCVFNLMSKKPALSLVELETMATLVMESRYHVSWPGEHDLAGDRPMECDWRSTPLSEAVVMLAHPMAQLQVALTLHPLPYRKEFDVGELMVRLAAVAHHHFSDAKSNVEALDMLLLGVLSGHGRDFSSPQHDPFAVQPEPK